MISNRPYLLRAFHEWIVDSNCTPILVFNATNPRCKVPKEYLESEEIVFNIANSAVRDLKMTNDAIEFRASFSGVIHLISAPISAVLAIYAEENGEGLFFDGEEEGATETEVVTRQLRSIEGTAAAYNPDISATEAPAKNKPFLTLVE